MLIWPLFSVFLITRAEVIVFVPMHDFHLLILKRVGVACVHVTMGSWLLCISELYPFCYVPFPSLHVFSSDLFLPEALSWRWWELILWTPIENGLCPDTLWLCQSSAEQTLLVSTYQCFWTGITQPAWPSASITVGVMRAWVEQVGNCFNLVIWTCCTDTICYYQLDL